MYLFKGATSYTADGYEIGDVLIDGVTISKKASISVPSDCIVINSENLIIIPGFVDVHVHLREPGFFYKESIASGTEAAASAGYTALCSMPNLNPVSDSVEHLKMQLDIIAKSAKVKVYPYAAITLGEKGETLCDMQSLAPYVVAFSDDGRGVQSASLMREAMLRAKTLGKAIVAHCEDDSLLNGGYVHDGEYSRLNGHKGIPSESEWKQIERDLALVEETGCKYHVCHISTKESVGLIREAKAKGLDVTCETAPHYLVLTDMDISEDSGRFKMNPPLRSATDRDALVCGLADGTIDCVATDHAPHSDEEKSKGLRGSLNGVIGLESAFAVLYTKLVKTGKLSLHRLIEAMSTAPRRIFGLPQVAAAYDLNTDNPTSDNSTSDNLSASRLAKAENTENTCDFAVLDLDYKWTIAGQQCLSKGSSTPFEGMEVQGKNMYTILDGEMIWKNRKEN